MNHRLSVLLASDVQRGEAILYRLKIKEKKP
jgi:hypothetical protein